MKTEITKIGLLKITAETELESYALCKWLEENPDSAIPNQLFVYGMDVSEFIA